MVTDTPKTGEHFVFPFADGTAKLCGRDHEVRESSVRREQPVRIEDAKAGNDFWSMETSFIVITQNL